MGETRDIREHHRAGTLDLLVRRYREHLSDPYWASTTVFSFAVIAAALYINFWAIKVATERASNRVADLILSNIPLVEVDGLFVYGTLACMLFTALVVVPRPRRIPFVLLGLSIFIVIRSAFTLLTHLAPPEASYASDFGETITSAFFGADQFFSGHTGMPFLGALAFWGRRWIRTVFLAFSIFFAGVVLAGHIHYSIDVASAFFITYGIFELSKRLLPREHAAFADDLKGSDERAPERIAS